MADSWVKQGKGTKTAPPLADQTKKCSRDGVKTGGSATSRRGS